MNYGNGQIEKRKKNISSKANRTKRRIAVRLFRAFVICALVVCLVGICGMGIFVKGIIAKTPLISVSDIKPAGSLTYVVDEEGNALDTFYQQGSNRIYTKYEDIPKHLSDAFVAIEDERFRAHNGIDLQGILRAGLIGITSGHFSQGASTITQQLIKNNVFPKFTEEKTFSESLERKLQEQYLALELEKHLSHKEGKTAAKNEILEAYMNTINLGEGALGVQTASRRYFGKDVSELTLSECAVIAAITKNPTKYDPVVYPDSNKKRRGLVLDHMKKQKLITEEEFQEAMADPVYDRIKQAAEAKPEEKPNSYFIDALFKQVIDDMIERKGYTQTQAYNAIYSGGLTIIATQEQRIQQICDEEISNPANYPYDPEYGLDYALTVAHEDGSSDNYSKEMLASYLTEKTESDYPLVFSSPDSAYEAIDEYKATLGITETDVVTENIDITPQPQISFVVMDPYNGKVKAIVGGRGEKKGNLSLNRATQSLRQPGSCFKVLATYAPAIDSAGYTLATIIVDEPFFYDSGKEVLNWDMRNIGPTTVRNAIAQSINVCAVKTITAIGPQTGYDMLLNFGFTSLVGHGDKNHNGMDDIHQPIAIGGITDGVSNYEITAAFSAVANGGVYVEPILYTKVVDEDGNTVLDNTTPITHQVIKSSTAALLRSAMEDVVKVGTGQRASISGMPVAGKSGTSEHTRDLWFCGFTPYYSASIWTGYDCGMPMQFMGDQSWHEQLWSVIMSRINESLPYQEFTMPDDIETRSICRETGLLADKSCNSYTEYFAKGTAPIQKCPGHLKPAVKPKPKEEKKEKRNQDTSNKPDKKNNPDQPAPAEEDKKKQEER